MEKSVREMLEAPFAPEQIKQRKGNFGAVLDYIECHSIIQRINDATEGEWKFEIIWEEIKEEEVLVKGRLSIGNSSREQFGSSKITRNREDGSIISIGDDFKAAASSCLRKLSSLYGVGLSLYRNDQNSTSNGSKNSPPQRPNGNNRESKNSNSGNGNGNGRATPKQLKAIFAIAQDKGISNKEVRDICVDEFGKTPDYLSIGQASQIIKELSARELKPNKSNPRGRSANGRPQFFHTKTIPQWGRKENYHEQKMRWYRNQRRTG